MIYFDNAATTRALPAVAEKMSTMLCEQYGNPASVSAMGLAAEKEIRNAAEIIARGIRCKYDEVFFTSGGTEGDNWAIYGTAEGYKRQGQHFITTEIEHPAVKNPMKLLEEKGAEDHMAEDGQIRDISPWRSWQMPSAPIRFCQHDSGK